MTNLNEFFSCAEIYSQHHILPKVPLGRFGRTQHNVQIDKTLVFSVVKYDHEVVEVQRSVEGQDHRIEKRPQESHSYVTCVRQVSDLNYYS